MKYLLPALLIVFFIYTVSSYPEPVIGNNVNDFTFYNSNFYLAFNNGTIASIGEGKLKWAIEVGDRGVPVHISIAPPYGILVLTDRAWLGLISFNGVPLSWLNLPLDPNSIKHGSSDLLYSEGIVLTYAGKGAVVASCPDLRVLLTRLVANKYLQGSISPDGDLALLVGFDTFCSICINNEEKLVSVFSPKTGESIFNGVVKQLKSAAIDRRNNWLILAQWTSLVVYDLNRGVLDSPV
ncbi:MAG: hypothetical protein NZ954_07525, partial [Thermofilaceae archaeon]|nr:hypothetical protein [Thermofilaceae archaeon]